MRSIPEGCGTDTGPGRQCPGQMAGRQDAEGLWRGPQGQGLARVTRVYDSSYCIRSGRGEPTEGREAARGGGGWGQPPSRGESSTPAVVDTK